MRLTKFESAYVECLLWSSTDEQDDFLDANYSLHDFSEETILKIRKDCDEFGNKAGALLDDISDDRAGHDFWLTRNRHGAGFWDRGYGQRGDELTSLAHSFGECYAYVGDDGKIYLS